MVYFFVAYFFLSFIQNSYSMEIVVTSASDYEGIVGEHIELAPTAPEGSKPQNPSEAQSKLSSPNPTTNDDTASNNSTFKPKIILPHEIELPELAPGSIPDQLKRIIKTINKYASEKKPANAYQGILFYGPPGTGKTTLACLTAKETKRPIIIASASLIIDKFQGSGPANIVKLFDVARSTKNCILFLDEITNLAEGEKRGNNERECAIDALHAQMQCNKDLLIILACNEVDRLPTRMRDRFPGQQTIEVGLPNNSLRKNLIVHFSRLRGMALSPQQVMELNEFTNGINVRVLDYIFNRGSDDFAAERDGQLLPTMDDVKLAYCFIKDGKDLSKKDRMFLIRYFMKSKSLPEFADQSYLETFATGVEGCKASNIEDCIKELKFLSEEEKSEKICLRHWIIAIKDALKEKPISFNDRRDLWRHFFNIFQKPDEEQQAAVEAGKHVEANKVDAQTKNNEMLSWFTELEGSLTSKQCEEIARAAFDRACDKPLAKAHVMLAKCNIISTSPLTEAEYIALLTHDIFLQPVETGRPAITRAVSENEVIELAAILMECKATGEDIKQITKIARNNIATSDTFSPDNIRVAILTHFKRKKIGDEKSCRALVTFYLSKKNKSPVLSSQSIECLARYLRDCDSTQLENIINEGFVVGGRLRIKRMHYLEEYCTIMQDFLTHGQEAYDHTFGWLYTLRDDFEGFQQYAAHKLKTINDERNKPIDLKPCMEDFLLAAFDDCSSVRNEECLRGKIIAHLTHFYLCQPKTSKLPRSQAIAKIASESSDFSRKQLEDVFEHALDNRRRLGKILWWGDGLLNMYDLYVGLHSVLDDPDNNFTENVTIHSSRTLPVQREFFTIRQRKGKHKKFVDNVIELRALFEGYLAYHRPHKITNRCISYFECFLSDPLLLRPSLIKLIIDLARQEANNDEFSDNTLINKAKYFLDGPRWTMSLGTANSLSSGSILPIQKDQADDHTTKQTCVGE